jgi:hypothetical protein
VDSLEQLRYWTSGVKVVDDLSREPALICEGSLDDARDIVLPCPGERDLLAQSEYSQGELEPRGVSASNVSEAQCRTTIVVDEPPEPAPAHLQSRRLGAGYSERPSSLSGD